MADLATLGINTSKPGFYNDLQFIRNEQMNPAFLNEYNYFVTQKQFDKKYLENAKTKIEKIVKILYEELKKSNIKGACIDISSALMKILEKEEIWCCQFVGCLTQIFPKNTKIETNYFYLIDEPTKRFTAPHVWIYAPPFKIIDLSINLQHYTQHEEMYLPDYIIDDGNDFSSAQITAQDIVSPAAVMYYNANEEILFRQYLMQSPDTRDFIFHYEPFSLNINKINLKYIPIRSGAVDSDLEHLKSINFSGKYPYDIYIEKIKPIL